MILGAVGVAAVALGCQPELAGRSSLVSAGRVLAVKVTPPEAEARDTVTYEALVAAPDGNLTNLAPAWDYCTARKPLAELGPVNRVCLEVANEYIQPLGRGFSVKGTLPADTCRAFGPDVPPVQAGEAYGRPADPDVTGGYYQPLRAVLPVSGSGNLTIGASRISCGVAGASADNVAEFRSRYHANENPVIASLAIDGVTVEPDPSKPASVAANKLVTLHVEWPVCPATDVCGDGICGADETRASCEADCAKPAGCKGSERFVYYDTENQKITVRNEEMRVSYFATSGSFEVDRTGRSEEDREATTEVGYTTPSAAGRYLLWLVLRDARGGVGWGSYSFDVK